LPILAVLGYPVSGIVNISGSYGKTGEWTNWSDLLGYTPNKWIRVQAVHRILSMLMNYPEWCEYVLGAYLEGARNSLEVRRDGLRPEQVARRVFGPKLVRQAEFGESTPR